ncbi:MAG: metalloregulator ArsR/SmtB family transcription factor [Sulfuriferula sp.]|nr:metalloregulator ArsR/SmtB family transcription factor [Sulfuriferula sp.]
MVTEADFFDAFSDETRRRILALLAQEGELCVCELHYALDMPQPKVSRHLSVLRDTGMLSMRRDGTWIYYQLAPEMPEWGKAVFAALQGVWQSDAARQLDNQRLLTMDNRPARCCAS